MYRRCYKNIILHVCKFLHQCDLVALKQTCRRYNGYIKTKHKCAHKTKNYVRAGCFYNVIRYINIYDNIVDILKHNNIAVLRESMRKYNYPAPQYVYNYALHDNNTTLLTWINDRHATKLTNTCIYIFSSLAVKNCYKSLQWLLNNNKITNHRGAFESAFRMSMFYGNIRACKWLYARHKIRLHVIENNITRIAVTIKKIELYEWIINMYPIRKHVLYKLATTVKYTYLTHKISKLLK